MSSFVFAQEEEDLGTQEVTVIKSYTPSLQDVFKLESPEVIDSIVAPKKTVDYQIFLFLWRQPSFHLKAQQGNYSPRKQTPI